MLNFQKIIRLHFFLLILLLFNFGLKEAVGYGINNNLATGLKAILFLTGIALFFGGLKPFKKASIYYSYFILTPVVLAVFYFVHGIFLGLLSSLLLAPVMPLQPDYNDGNIKVYSKFNGFLGRCCEYYITQDRVFLFEEFKGTIYTESNFDNVKVTLKNDSALIYSDSVHRVKLN
jgi:hypothetical protein